MEIASLVPAVPGIDGRGAAVLPGPIWGLLVLAGIAIFCTQIGFRIRRANRGRNMLVWRLVPHGTRPEGWEDTDHAGRVATGRAMLERHFSATHTMSIAWVRRPDVDGRPGSVEQYMAINNAARSKDGKGSAAVERLASAWGWRAEKVTMPEDLAAIVADLEVRQAFVEATDPRTPSPASVSAFSNAMHDQLASCTDGALVVATFEPAYPWEAKRMGRWLRAEETKEASGTNNSAAGTDIATVADVKSLKATVVAAADTTNVDLLLTAFSGTAGNPQSIRTRRVSNIIYTSVPVALFGLAALLNLFGGFTGKAIMQSVIVGVITTIGVATGDGWWKKRLAALALPVERPAKGGLNYLLRAALNSSWFDGNKQQPGKQKLAPYARPWSPRTMWFSLKQLTSIGLVPSNVTHAAGAGETQRRAAHPAVLVDVDGSRVGWDTTGAAVRIPDNDRYRGVVFFGNPGTGKTTALLQVLIDDLHRRLRRDACGLQLIDVKGETTRRALAMAKQIGYTDDQITVINIADTTGPRLELFDRDLDPRHAAMSLVEAMRYAWDGDDIRSQSRDILFAVFWVAYAIPRHTWPELWGGSMPDVMRVANALLGGGPKGDETATQLVELLNRIARGESPDTAAAAPAGEEFLANVDAGEGVKVTSVSELIATPGDSQLAAALAQLGYWWSRPARERTQAFAAPRNKVGALLGTSMWGDEPGNPRPALLLPDLVRDGSVLFVNFGATEDAPGPAADLARILGSMFLAADWNAIQANCGDWYSKGRHTVVATDELGSVCGVGDGASDLIQSMLDLGRSMGVRLLLATQRPDQLPKAVAGAVLNAGFRGWFNFEAPATCEQAALDISGPNPEPGAFTADDIRKLRRGECVVRARAEDQPMPPFTLLVAATDWVQVQDDTPPDEVAARLNRADTKPVLATLAQADLPPAPPEPAKTRPPVARAEDEVTEAVSGEGWAPPGGPTYAAHTPPANPNAWLP
ncbi:MAG TPA: hypothetical protein VHD87_12620 [Acidimicrobiales bacterium]|nr:hypothetical protein [Acidimicrobiales bacterium]